MGTNVSDGYWRDGCGTCIHSQIGVGKVFTYLNGHWGGILHDVLYVTHYAARCHFRRASNAMFVILKGTGSTVEHECDGLSSVRLGNLILLSLHTTESPFFTRRWMEKRDVGLARQRINVVSRKEICSSPPRSHFSTCSLVEETNWWLRRWMKCTKERPYWCRVVNLMMNFSVHSLTVQLSSQNTQTRRGGRCERMRRRVKLEQGERKLEITLF